MLLPRQVHHADDSKVRENCSISHFSHASRTCLLVSYSDKPHSHHKTHAHTTSCSDVGDCHAIVLQFLETSPEVQSVGISMCSLARMSFGLQVDVDSGPENAQSHRGTHTRLHAAMSATVTQLFCSSSRHLLKYKASGYPCAVSPE